MSIFNTAIGDYTVEFRLSVVSLLVYYRELGL